MNRSIAFLLLGLALGVSPVLNAADAPVAPAASLPGQSLYHLQVTLTDQHGASVPWTSLRGRPQLVSMFYGNCHLILIFLQACLEVITAETDDKNCMVI